MTGGILGALHIDMTPKHAEFLAAALAAGRHVSVAS
jgi:hypothetical protein